MMQQAPLALRALVPQPRASGTRSLSILDALLRPPAPTEPKEVLFMDPKSLWEVVSGMKAADVLQQATPLVVPPKLWTQLFQGKQELGEADDPANSWSFGRDAEVFQYTFVGVHPTQSGLTSIVPREEVERLLSGAVNAKELPEWEEFRDDVMAGAVRFPSRRTPFLFSGIIIDSPAAAVYKLVQDQELVGVMVSSEADASH